MAFLANIVTVTQHATHEIQKQSSGPGRIWTGSMSTPRKALRGGIQKSILKDFSGNVGDSRQMLTKARKWLQERGRDTPTKGLLWQGHTVKFAGFVGSNFQRQVTQFAPLKAPKLRVSGKLTSDERFVLHRVAGAAPGTLQLNSGTRRHLSHYLRLP